METVTIVWTVAAGISITLAGLCAAAWMVERRDPTSLTLSILGVAAAASAYIELRMMHSATPAEYGKYLRWYHVSIYLAMLGQILFVHYFLGSSRLWLMWAVISLRTIVVLVNFLVYPDFNFSSITSLRHYSLLGNQVAAIGAAVPRAGWQQLATASLVLLVAYLVDSAVRKWGMPGTASKRRALVVTFGLTVPMLCELGYGQLQLFGIVHGPFSFLPWFLGALLIMANELVRDVIVSKRALIELAESHRQLARTERIGILGQLASSIAHELTQPLSANVLNANVGLKELNQEKPSLGELRTILSDLESDSQRAADVITRIRKFLKVEAIELRPLAVEEIVKDVLSLIGADVTSKQVALSIDIQPGLPKALGDRVHLSQVLLNLLMNSIQAVQSCPPYARHVAIEAWNEQGKDRIEIIVRDSGQGIPGDIADKIFQPFFTTKSEGMGIGLALSRVIIEAHGGHIWADRTAAEKGTAFRFTLQRA